MWMLCNEISCEGFFSCLHCTKEILIKQNSNNYNNNIWKLN